MTTHRSKRVPGIVYETARSGGESYVYILHEDSGLYIFKPGPSVRRIRDTIKAYDEVLSTSGVDWTLSSEDLTEVVSMKKAAEINRRLEATHKKMIRRSN